MKIIHQVQVEEGDTIAGIIAKMGDYLGKKFDKNTVWDFNRNSMPSPGSMPAIGTILRFPHDPADESGAPGLEELKNPSLSDEQVSGAERTLGGDRTTGSDHQGADGSLPGGLTTAPGGAPAGEPAPNPGQDGQGAGGLPAGAGEEGFTES